MGVFNGTTGLDLFTGSSAADAFRFENGELQSADVVNGGGGVDTLEFLTGNSGITSLLLNAASFTNVRQIEKIVVRDDVLTSDITITNTLVSRSGFVNSAAAAYDFTVTTGLGAETINVSNVAVAYNVLVDAGGGDDILTGGKSNSHYVGGNGVDLFRAGLGAEVFEGGTTYNASGLDSDTVEGTAAAINGDTYYGRTAAALFDGDAFDAIRLTNGGTFAFTQSGFEWLTLYNATNAVTVTLLQQNFDFTVTGGSAADTVHIAETAGYVAGATHVVLNGNGGADHLYGSSHDDVINGGAASDYIEGGNGADTITGGAGADIMLGGDGGDTYLAVGSTDAIGESAEDSGVDRVETTVRTYTLANNVEELVYTSNLSSTLTANSTGNTITGGGGADAVYALGGDDIVHAGNGNDTVEGGDGDDDLYGEEHSDTLRGNADQDNLYGGRGDDLLYGGTGHDHLAGGDGDDLLDGGDGVDYAVYTGETVGLTIDMSLLTQQVLQGIFHDTLAGIEYIRGSDGDDVFHADPLHEIIFYGGLGYDLLDYSSYASAINFTLSTDAEEVHTGSGNDTIDHVANMEAGAGDDLMYDDDAIASQVFHGDAGSDTVSYEHDGSLVLQTELTVDLANDANNSGWASLDKYSSIENAIGNDTTEDTIWGNDADNHLVGLGGDDSLVGGLGNDTLEGGDGFDQLLGDAGNDIIRPGVGVFELIYGGADTDTLDYSDTAFGVVITACSDVYGVQQIGGGAAAGDGIEGIENITGSLAGDVLTGDGAANVLDGNNGNDVLAGMGGADTLSGGQGSDTVSYAGSANVVTVNLVTQTASGGDATGDVISGFENVTGGAGADTLTGDSGNNVIEGGAGADVLDGGGGINTLSYRTATGNVSVSLHGGTATGNDAAGDFFANFTNISGSDFDDTFTGDAGDNEIRGEAGDDRLTGGNGSDSLYGGTGADTFRYLGLSHSAAGAGDHIFDFNQAEGDRIDLSAIDAVVGGTDSAFVFTGNGGTDPFTHTAGELRWTDLVGVKVVYLDGDGDGSADTEIILSETGNGANVGTLTVADFIL